MSQFKLNDANQGLATKGQGRSWGHQRKQGLLRYNAWVDFYNTANQDEERGDMKAILFDDAPAVYWSKDVLISRGDQVGRGGCRSAYFASKLAERPSHFCGYIYAKSMEMAPPPGTFSFKIVNQVSNYSNSREMPVRQKGYRDT